MGGKLSGYRTSNLLHHAEHVHLAPVVDDLSIRYAPNRRPTHACQSAKFRSVLGMRDPSATRHATAQEGLVQGRPNCCTTGLGRATKARGVIRMDAQVHEAGQDPRQIKLDRLEGAMARGEHWSHDDQGWLIAELRRALSRLGEGESYIPVDLSRIG